MTRIGEGRTSISKGGIPKPNRRFAPRWRQDDPLLPDYRQVSCPVAEAIGEQVVWLHHRVLLGNQQDLHELAGAITKLRDHAERAVGVA